MVYAFFRVGKMQQDKEAKHTGLMRSGWQKELLKAFIFATLAKYLQESLNSFDHFWLLEQHKMWHVLKNIFVIYKGKKTWKICCWTIKACSANPPCAFHLSSSGNQSNCDFWRPKVHKTQIFYFTLGHCLVQTDAFHLTLPPEILPVHLAAQPAWTPGPGSFHYGTAEGHSRPAKEKRTRVRHRSDVNTAKISNTKATDQKPQNYMHVSTQAGQG